MSYFEDFEEWRIGDLDYDELQSMPKRTRYYAFEFCKDKWKTRDGQILELKDMTKNHIINSLNVILRICYREHLNPNSYKIYNNLRKELKRRNKNE